VTFTIDLHKLRQQAGLQGPGSPAATPQAATVPLPAPTPAQAAASPASVAKRLTPVPPISQLAGLAGLASNDSHDDHGRPDATDTMRLARMARLGWAEDRALAAVDALAQRDACGDERRFCVECSHLSDSGRCVAAATGRIRNADRRFEPVQDVLQRCEAFALRRGFV
jgi:hypothetical protein